MTTFRFYAHPDGLQQGFDYVKVGFSWWAFFFDIIWLLLNRAWGASVLYLVGFYAFSVAGSFIIISLSLPNEENLLSIFDWVSYFTAHFVVGWFGNSLLERRLLRKGFKLVSTVQSRDPDAEINRLREVAEPPTPLRGLPG